MTEIAKDYDGIIPLAAEEKWAMYYVVCTTYMNGLGYYDETYDLFAHSNRALVFLSKNKEKFLNLL